LNGNAFSNISIGYNQANPTSINVGSGISGGALFNGSIYEVLVYNTLLTTNQCQQIEGYLAWKWGTQASLPSFTSPLQVPGCQLWLDAADSSSFTLSGSTLLTIKDKSASNNSMTVVSAPTYSATGFNSSPCFVLASGNSITCPVSNVTTQDIMMVAVWKQTVNSMSSPFSLGSAGSGSEVGLIWHSVENRYLAYTYGGGDSHNSTYSYNVNVIDIGIKTSGVMSCWLNGTVGDSVTPSRGNTASTIYVGGGSWAMTGNLAEILFYVGTITTTQRQQVEGYLAWKWGLQSSLPVTHPYYGGSPNHSYASVAPTGASLRPAISAALVPAGVRGVTAKLNLKNYTQTFTYTGADQPFTVPATTTSLTVYMWGAGGGGGYTGTGTLYGGAGAYLQGVLSVTPGQSLKIIVGGGGGYQPNVVGSTPLSYGGGGFGSPAGGAGGGRSAIRVSGASDDSVTVGAGGGAAYWSYNNSYGGNGDSVTGTGGNGGTSGSYYGGLGGSQTAGGAVGHGDGGDGSTAGSKYTGGNPNAQTGGGGGSGYYGGGGGGYYNYGSGGGGGSSLTTNLTSIVAYNSSNIYSAPYTTSPYYQSGVAAGGSNGLSGGNGLVVITYLA